MTGTIAHSHILQLKKEPFITPHRNRFRLSWEGL